MKAYYNSKGRRSFVKYFSDKFEAFKFTIFFIFLIFIIFAYSL